MTPDSAETPLGLRQLASLERVGVRAAAAGSGCRYVVEAAGGGELLRAREDGAGLVSLLAAGKTRPFHFDLYDTQDTEVIKLRRPYSVGQDKMEVSVRGAAGPVAVVRRELTFLKPVLSIRDAADRPLFRVKGPLSTSGDCDFELYSTEKERIGVIGKRWSGAGAARARARDGGGGADSFAVRFPPELDVRHKAAIIGTCLFIDFLIFDN